MCRNKKGWTVLTKNEATKIMRIISVAYPNYRPQYDKEQMLDAIDLWSVMFGEFPYEVVAIAVKQYIDGEHEFAPSIGQIKSIIKTIMNPNEMSEAEAWNLVLNALTRSAYFAEEEFEKLPQDVQKAIGSPAYLRELALSEEFNSSVESSNFYRNYRAVKERKKKIEDVPQNVLDYIAARNDVAQIENKQEKDSQERRERYSDLVQRAMDNYKSSIPEEEEEEPEPVRDSRLDELRKRWGMNA